VRRPVSPRWIAVGSARNDLMTKANAPSDALFRFIAPIVARRDKFSRFHGPLCADHAGIMSRDPCNIGGSA
jgi:hypothetical protein